MLKPNKQTEKKNNSCDIKDVGFLIIFIGYKNIKNLQISLISVPTITDTIISKMFFVV